jgi:hypothetical protein
LFIAHTYAIYWNCRSMKIFFYYMMGIYVYPYVSVFIYINRNIYIKWQILKDTKLLLKQKSLNQYWSLKWWNIWIIDTKVIDGVINLILSIGEIWSLKIVLTASNLKLLDHVLSFFVNYYKKKFGAIVRIKIALCKTTQWKNSNEF